MVQVTADPTRHVSYGALLAGAQTTLELVDATPTKPTTDYRLVGQSVPRVDIPAKVSGELVFVHDMRVPGMLHGRVVRPPYAGADHGDFIGNTLESVDEQSIAHIPGIRAVVVDPRLRRHRRRARRAGRAGAARAEGALEGLARLAAPGHRRALEQALRANPSTPAPLVDEGDVDAALAARRAADAAHLRVAVPDARVHRPVVRGGRLAQRWQHGRPRMTVWAGTQNPHVLRADLAR